MFADDSEPMVSIYVSKPFASEQAESELYWALFHSLGIEIGIGHDYVNVYSLDNGTIQQATAIIESKGFTVAEIAGA